jgi:hypothetical protein
MSEQLQTPVPPPSAEDKELSTLASRIRAEYADVNTAVSNVLAKARVLGETLNRAKDKIGHGKFGQWLKANCKLSERTAQRYMQLATDWTKLQAKLTDQIRHGMADLSLNKAIELIKDTSNDNMFVEGLGDLPVFPCWKSPDPILNKSPANTHGFYEAELIELSPDWGYCGVRAGYASGIDCLDIDPEGEPWYRLNFDSLPQTWTNETRRSVHVLFKHAPGLRKSENRIAKGVDVRADGSYFIWWPREGLPFEDHPLSEWPDWLLAEAMGESAIPENDHPLFNCLRAPLTTQNKYNVDLTKIDPTEYNHQVTEWIGLMTSCKVAGVDREAFVAWSISDPEYADQAENIRGIWDRLKPNGEIGEGRLFRALRNKGEPEDNQIEGIPIPPKHRRKMTLRDRARISSIASLVARSKADEDRLFWAACRYGECRMAIKVGDRMLEQMLISASWTSGLRDKARMLRQIRNGLRIGSQQPNWEEGAKHD